MKTFESLTHLFECAVFKPHTFTYTPADSNAGNQWVWQFTDNQLGMSVIDSGYGQLEACLFYNDAPVYNEELGFENCIGWMSVSDVVAKAIEVSNFEVADKSFHTVVKPFSGEDWGDQIDVLSHE